MILKNKNTILVEPGIAKTYLLQYQKDTNFIFNKEGGGALQINIHSINCLFEIDFKGEIIYQKEFESYSFIIDSEHNNITIKPLIDIIDGRYKENYGNKNCPMLINSFLLTNNQAKIKIENNEENIFYLYYSFLNISYEIDNIFEDSFVSLYFQFNEKSNFSINVYYQNEDNQNNSLIKYIYNSSYIFLNSEFLKYNYSKTKGIIFIEMNNLDNKSMLMHFKIIEKETVTLLQKNYLNIGFSTSKTTYQYYFTEVFQGEEGELMLHNKRMYGLLHGKIIDKNDMNEEDLYNRSKYPEEELNDTISNNLIYYKNLLRMNFSYENTSHCLNGCYLLITFEQRKSEGNYSLVGYEYTILTRFWNYTDYISQIVDIPFNEYIIGAFEFGSILHHYYSISIPDDVFKIIIQIESNYLDGFYGEGRLKINTAKTIGKTKKFNIINNQHVFILDMKQLNFSEKFISFAFRPRDYYMEIFAFYYFRVLYIRENETIFFPIDSYLGNLCIPEIDNITKLYYCNLIFKNNYNELSNKFAITQTVQNEYFIINITKIFIDGRISTVSKKFNYIN